MAIEDALGNQKQNKITQLRKDLSIAEINEDEEKVLVLEAELRAVEKGEVFDRIAFLAARDAKRKQKEESKKRKTKHQVLREMQALPMAINDSWTYDGLNEDGTAPYEGTFYYLLEKFDVGSFQELVYFKSLEVGRKIKILDLFGGAHFLDNLNEVSRLIGVRLRNIDQDILEDLNDLPLDSISRQ